MDKDREKVINLESVFQNAFSSLQEAIGKYEHVKTFELADGNEIRMSHPSENPNWHSITIAVPSGPGGLNFMIGPNGLENIGSFNPVLSVGASNFDLFKFGVGFLTSTSQLLIKDDGNQNEEFAFLLGMELSNWVTKSIEKDELQPFNAAINLLTEREN